MPYYKKPCGLRTVLIVSPASAFRDDLIWYHSSARKYPESLGPGLSAYKHDTRVIQIDCNPPLKVLSQSTSGRYRPWYHLRI